jgi:preprotein translocase subunit YajC
MLSILHAFLSQTAEQGQSGRGLFENPLVLLPIIFLIFWFVMWRPQQKERKRQAEWLASIKKGDEIVTQSGIVGTVFQVEDRLVTLDVGGGNKLRILKSTVASAWKQSTEPAQPAKAEAKK